MPQFRKLSYEKRLRKLKLTTLKERRQRGDMIEVFKLLAGVENIDCNQFFTPATTCYALRRHDRKLVKMRSRLDTRKFFFSQRVVSSWNSLPASVVQATSVNYVQERIRHTLPEEWTSELQAACPSTYNYKYKYKWVDNISYLLKGAQVFDIKCHWLDLITSQINVFVSFFGLLRLNFRSNFSVPWSLVAWYRTAIPGIRPLDSVVFGQRWRIVNKQAILLRGF